MRALLALVALVACSPAYVDTLAPKDASFGVDCGGPCASPSSGDTGRGRQGTVQIDVRFAKKYGRRYSLCCSHRHAVIARLGTVRDLWCAGLDVGNKTFGELTVGVTTSELSGKRAATLDQGTGYVAFQCGDWLPKLIDALEQANCCAEQGS